MRSSQRRVTRHALAGTPHELGQPVCVDLLNASAANVFTQDIQFSVTTGPSGLTRCGTRDPTPMPFSWLWKASRRMYLAFLGRTRWGPWRRRWAERVRSAGGRFAAGRKSGAAWPLRPGDGVKGLAGRRRASHIASISNASRRRTRSRGGGRRALLRAPSQQKSRKPCCSQKAVVALTKPSDRSRTRRDRGTFH
jgi:hypothetical protein